MVTSRLPKYFEDPLTYRPERWLDPKIEKYPFAILPFGYGNRMCAGKRFSELQLYLVTAKLIRKYEIRAVQSRLDLKFCFIIIPAHKISLKLRVRQQWIYFLKYIIGSVIQFMRINDWTNYTNHIWNEIIFENISLFSWQLLSQILRFISIFHMKYVIYSC